MYYYKVVILISDWSIARVNPALNLSGPIFIIWLALQANQILSCDWLPEQARWSYLAHLGLPAMSREKHFPENQIINPLLTKLFRSRWLDMASFFLCEFMDIESVSVHKYAKKKELGQYPAISTLRSVNNPYIFSTVWFKRRSRFYM